MKRMLQCLLGASLVLAAALTGCRLPDPDPSVTSGTLTVTIQSSAGSKAMIATEDLEVVKANVALRGPEGYFQSQTWSKGGGSDVLSFDGLSAGDNTITITEYDPAEQVLNTYAREFSARIGYHHRIRVILGLSASILVDWGADVMSDYAVRIPDEQLRLSIEEAVGKRFGLITYSDLAAVTFIDCKLRPIASLVGIEYCSSLYGINLGGTGIADITPLRGVPSLRWLVAYNSNLTDITPLLSLPGLRVVQVGGNPLDLDDLSIFTTANFENLEGLGFDGQDETTGALFISVDQALAMLTPFTQLVEVGVTSIPFGDSGFQLLYESVIHRNAGAFAGLDLGNTGISDASLATIAGLVSLRGLNLWGDPLVTDLSLLTSLTNLNFLGLAGSGVTDLAPLRTLYDSGAFRVGAKIEMQWLGLDLSTGTPNRDIVDYLVANDVDVLYEDGNITD